jgi:endogenous inhibitor of DNA gyrase (YacG/DUF329 family)
MKRQHFRFCPICGTKLSWFAILANDEQYMASCPLCGMRVHADDVNAFTPDVPCIMALGQQFDNYVVEEHKNWCGKPICKLDYSRFQMAMLQQIDPQQGEIKRKDDYYDEHDERK